MKMETSGAVCSSGSVSAASPIHANILQMKSGPSGVLLKIRGNGFRRGGKKRTRGESPAVDDTAVCVLTALRDVSSSSSSPLHAVELRHAGLTAMHVLTAAGDEATAASPPTLSALFSSTAFTSLHTVDLECNRLGDDGVARLCLCCLPQLRSLKCLFLASNRIGPGGLRAIVSFVEGGGSGPHPLEAVGLTNNSLFPPSDNDKENSSAVLLGRLAQACGPMLRRLHLNHVGMPTSAAVAMVSTCIAVGKKAPAASAHSRVMIYMKQNAIDKESFESTLRDLDAGAATHMFFV